MVRHRICNPVYAGSTPVSGFSVWENKMSNRTYDWFCPVCERGCYTFAVDTGKELEYDSENYARCPTCGDRLVGWDEQDE